MRRILPYVAVLALLCFANVREAQAGCQQRLMAYWVDVEWGDGSHGGHWQFGWFDVCDGGGGGGGTLPGPGGGGIGPQIPQDLLAQRDLYLDNNCTTPAYGDFLDEDEYAATGMGTWFPWEDYRMSDQPYVLVSDALAAGAQEIGLCMDNNMPRISAPGSGGGYRTPGLNAQTPCGQHTSGNALDLSMRAMDVYGNNTGTHDCQLWNALAACANAAGGWVEPWSDIQASGVLHFHVSFGQPANTPAQYGDACANP
jgi:hypothetical protein